MSLTFSELSRPLALALITCAVWLVPPVQGLVPEHNLQTLKATVLVIDALVLALLLSIYRRPGRGRPRYYVSTALDALAVSAALYLGEAALAPVSALYLWIIVGRAFVSGPRFMYVATGLSLGGFGLVYLASPFWRENTALSVTIVSVIALLVPFLSLMLRRMQRAEALARYRADHDALTHLLNRRAFTERLASLLAQSEGSLRRAKVHFLMFLDLDRFKAINDEGGHAAGDCALCDIAELIEQACDKNGFAGRMGGDEFCILLTDTPLAEARAVAEDLRNTVAGYRLAWGGRYFDLGVSIGLASSESVTDADSWMRLADTACYAAKNNGRNQVHVVDRQSTPADAQGGSEPKLKAVSSSR
ncbi:MAG: GGDEF domain-containing protein [Pseudomonadota bacterium]